MKNSRVCVVMSAVLLLAVAAGYAEDKPTATSAAPAPAAEMAKLKAYEGKWTCTGQINASPFGPAHKSSTRVTAHFDLGGFWLSGRVAESKTAESPMPIEGMFHETWDPGAKQFLMLWVDNSGGWAQETSAGWEGDTMVWTGDGFGGGQKMGERDSFTMKGPGEFAHTMAINVSGQWTPLGEETCRQASAPAAAAPKK